MKELQVLPGLEPPVRKRPESGPQRRKRRKRRRMMRKLRRWMLRAGAAAAFCLLAVLLFFGGRFFFQTFFVKEKEVFSEQLAQSATEGKSLIVLDAGHGGRDQGTHAGRLLEKEVNLSVAKLVEKQLEKAGLCVWMTREGDDFVGLSDRCAQANEKEAALFVSIHCNFCEDSANVKGIEFYHLEGSSGGAVLAEEMNRKFAEESRIANRGIRTADFRVLRETQMPAVLVELGYFSNSGEREKLGRKSYQKLLAECIAEAIIGSELLQETADEPANMENTNE